ncbi:GntR family transcriptional regulator [Chelativorans sp. SCAU2101]|jgi:Transcriptional regulators|uniref:GntR family transcriptional regulator n=1 Tax=Chelativorans petroleitrophicus TaxID=2975484 RepID=A0A9X2XAJ6_9HYPH|nr:GntR family transcriptional regulator [Chelativorans petroleitrophicus]MCT8991975.1 GntR family transcriptional regulator [Chelativorans petroleitrophicus]
MPRRKRTLAGFDIGEALAGADLDRSLPIVAQVYSLLRERIIDNRLPPEAPLVEADLAALLRISRTPLRAALQRLAAEDLIETRPQVGSVVAPVNVGKIVEAVFCRSALECQVAERLASAPFHPARFEAVLAAQREACKRDDYLAFYRHDDRFHALLAEVAGVPAAWRLVQIVKPHVDRARLQLMGSIPGRSEQAYREHVEILRAASEGDRIEVVRLMRAHVSTVFDALDKLADSPLAKAPSADQPGTPAAQPAAESLG